jgi:hypothetical protein
MKCRDIEEWTNSRAEVGIVTVPTSLLTVYGMSYVFEIFEVL